MIRQPAHGAALLFALLAAPAPSLGAYIQGQASGVISAGADPDGVFGLAGVDTYTGETATVRFKIDPSVGSPGGLNPGFGSETFAYFPTDPAAPVGSVVFDVELQINGIALPIATHERVGTFSFATVRFGTSDFQPSTDTLELFYEERHAFFTSPGQPAVPLRQRESSLALITEGPDLRSNTGAIPEFIPAGDFTRGFASVVDDAIYICNLDARTCDYEEGLFQEFSVTGFSLTAVPLPPAILFISGGLCGLFVVRRPAY